MAWTALFFAGLFEIVWAVGMKYTDGFTRLWPTVGTFAAMAVSLALLGFAMKTLPLGTAYAVWTGIGTAGTVIIGMILFHEPATALRLGAIGLIVIGGIGLKILGS
jgi:quaternary ammonium compound-resistance protein SugE